jgi:hypothetical protein
MNGGIKHLVDAVKKGEKRLEEVVEKNKEIVEKNKEMEKKIEDLEKRPAGKTINNGCNNTIYIQNTLNTPGTMDYLEDKIGTKFNLFTDPNLEYITDKYLHQLLDGKMLEDVTEIMTREVYANNKHPENSTVILSDESRKRVIGLQPTLGPDGIIRMWRRVPVDEWCTNIKNQMKKTIPSTEFPRVVNSLNKMNDADLLKSSMKGLTDTKAKMTNLIVSPKLLKLETYGYDTKRVLGYELEKIPDPKERLMEFLRKEWGKEAPDERRNIYACGPEFVVPRCENKFRAIRSWSGEHWSKELVGQTEDRARTFTRISEEMMGDVEFRGILYGELEKNIDFLQKQGLV